MPAHCTAGGKAILAQLAPEDVGRLHPGGRLDLMTSRSLSSTSGLPADGRSMTVTATFGPVPDRFTASALTHMFVVADVARSRDWYVRVLDASVHSEYGGTSVVVNLLGNWILLVTGGEPTDGKPTVTLAPPPDPDTVSSELIFRVADCRATHDLLRSRGADFLTEPVDRGGEIRAFFRDPDSHLLEISQLT